MDGGRSTSTRTGSSVSQRGQALTTPALSYLSHFLESKSRPWSAEDPDGYISLVVAENRLSFDILKPKLEKCLAEPMPAELECYDNFMGSEAFRKSIANLLMQTIMSTVKVDPDHICVSAGCGAILDNLFFCITEPGDSVLIPAPYYPAFDNDLRARCALVPQPVFMATPGELDVLALDAIAKEAALEGRPASSLLLTNPNNPLGTIYTKAELLDTMAWAFKAGVHIVSDEIYALSVFGEGAEFVSAMALLPEAAMQAGVTEAAAADLLHVVFGFSKDFCMSGFRVGCLYTRNETVNQALSNVSYFQGASNLVQHVLTYTISDAKFVDSYIEQNALRLRTACTLLEGALSEAGLKYIKPQGAMFVCVDLSEHLRKPSFTAERELFEALYEDERLLLTPGKDCHFAKPGNFRICFAAVPMEALPAGVARLSNFLKNKW